MYALLRPILFSMDAERAHHLGMAAARLAQSAVPSVVSRMYQFVHPSLRVSLWNRVFDNPVGLAAGFDKNAHLVKFWSQAGFGYCEIGSVSARPAEGNAKPRAFRLPEDQALINRMGLNNQGAEEISKRIQRLPLGSLPPVGINIAKTHNPDILGERAIIDFRDSFKLLAPLAGYLVLNISCPNTKEGKTFEEPEALNALLKAIMKDKKKMGLKVPVLIKLSPAYSPQTIFDSAIEEMLDIADKHGVEGFVVSNTASDRMGLQTSDRALEAIGAGGLSGVPLADRVTGLVRYIYRQTRGEKPIIAVGGVDSPERAYQNIRAGATLIQVYTGLVYKGLGLVKRINRGLVQLLQQDGYTTVQEAIGVDTKPPPPPVSKSKKKKAVMEAA